MHNKKLTIQVDDMPYLRLEACLSHIQRMLQKYPDFKINVVAFKPTSDNQKRVKFMETLLLKDKIEISLNNNEEQKNNKNKNKLKV